MRYTKNYLGDERWAQWQPVVCTAIRERAEAETRRRLLRGTGHRLLQHDDMHRDQRLQEGGLRRGRLDVERSIETALAQRQRLRKRRAQQREARHSANGDDAVLCGDLAASGKRIGGGDDRRPHNATTARPLLVLSQIAQH